MVLIKALNQYEHWELLCNECSQTVDIVTYYDLQELQKLNLPILCMDCDKEVADSVPDCLEGPFKPFISRSGGLACKLVVQPAWWQIWQWRLERDTVPDAVVLDYGRERVILNPPPSVASN